MGSPAHAEEYDEEIINGRVVLMSPRPAISHIRVAGNIYKIFSSFLEGRKCEAFPDGTELHLDEENVFIPDAMIVCNPDIVQNRGIFGVPDLVVEVLSPSTTKIDIGEKKEVYEKHGVKEYWIESPIARSIEVYLLKDGKFHLDEVYHGYREGELDWMKEEDRAKIAVSLKVSLYDDFVIFIKDIFARV